MTFGEAENNSKKLEAPNGYDLFNRNRNNNGGGGYYGDDDSMDDEDHVRKKTRMYPFKV